MNDMRNLAGLAAMITLAGGWSYCAISKMYQGSVAFMKNISGGSGFNISDINIMTAVIVVFSAALILSLVYLDIVFMEDKKNKNKKRIVQVIVLTVLLILGNILFWHLIPPTKLMIAIAERRPSSEIEELAQKSRNINTVREGYSALSLAVLSGARPETIKALAQNGADINISSPQDNMPVSILFLSSIANSSDDSEKTKQINIETVRALLDNGMDVNAETYTGVTAFTAAFGKNASPEIIQMLIEAGADINRQEIDPITGEKGVTALMIAAIDETEPAIADLLLENGADPEIITDSGVTVLMAAAGHDKNVKLVKKAINKGLDINAQTVRGTTALMTAARNNKGTEIIRILLESGADAAIKDKEGKTALDHLKGNRRMNAEDKKAARKLFLART